MNEFEPDWSKAPKCATGAILSLTWVFDEGRWAFGSDIAKYKRPAPVVTPHPHAEIIAKFAEVAARRVDPWVEFEYKCEKQDWRRCSRFIGSYPDFEYRYIGDNK
jgi:hypothetical protein